MSEFRVLDQETAQFELANDFGELLNYLTKENLEKENLSHNERAWENIPLIIPQSILLLEKNIKSVQSWCKYAGDQISIVFSGSLTQDLKTELKNHKIWSDEFKENVDGQFEHIMNRIYSINEIERKRHYREEQEKVEEIYFDKFFEAEKEPFREPREHKFLKMLLEKNSQSEYEEPRRYNLKQLYYIISRLLNQSQLNSKVKDLEDELKSVEERLEEKMKKQYDELNIKCSLLDSKIMDEKMNLKNELDKKDNEIVAYIKDQLIPRIAEDEKVIQSSVKEIGELRLETENLNKFKGIANQKFDQIMKQNDDFHEAFEKKINFYDDNFDFMKHKTEERLQEFLKIIDTKFTKLKQQSDEQVEMIKNEFFKFFEENNQRNIVTTEKLIAKGTKQIQDYDTETKKILNSFQETINSFNTENIKRNKDLRGRLEIFIKKFETFSKLKIEPATSSEARIHALESKFQELEEFFSYSTLFTKDIVKKLIYAIQKHNIGNIKITEEEEVLKEKRVTEPGSSFLVDVKENHLDPLSGEDSPKLKQSFYQGWGRRNNTSVGTRRHEKIIFPSIQVEGNSTNSSKQGFDIFPNSTKLQKRKQSLDTEKLHPSKKRDEGNTKQHVEFDNMLHKRLEALRKALIEETRISQNYNHLITKDATSQNKNSEETEAMPKVKRNVLSFYKDVNLVKVPGNSTHKRKSSVSKLNQTVSEFSDGHLYSKEQTFTENNTSQN